MGSVERGERNRFPLAICAWFLIQHYPCRPSRRRIETNGFDGCRLELLKVDCQYAPWAHDFNQMQLLR
jgi:hypothetical protein